MFTQVPFFDHGTQPATQMAILVNSGDDQGRHRVWLASAESDSRVASISYCNIAEAGLWGRC